MVELRPVDKNNIDDVLTLEVHEYQKSYVSTVAESLAQAYAYNDNAYPFAVYSDDEIVGFIMMGYYEVKQYYTLWKFLIDKDHQRRGYGRQALALGIKFLKDRFDVDSVYTGVVPG
uniref:GNAT family N-acetyltransferase n=1 Tax=Ruminococcus sp. TaxID=41978 RepID=UPI002583D298